MDALTEEELRSACRARGMRAPFGEGAVPFMQRQLTEWLDMSLNRSAYSPVPVQCNAGLVHVEYELPAASLCMVLLLCSGSSDLSCSDVKAT